MTTFYRLATVLAWAILLSAQLRGETFVRGDSNQDGTVDLSDARFTLDFLYLGGPTPECLAAADANDDEEVDLSDAVATLYALYVTGEPLPPPFPGTGFDPEPYLGCYQDPAANRPPSIEILTPAPGSMIQEATVRVHARLDDDRDVVRVLAGQEKDDVTPAGPPNVPYSVLADVPLGSGPQLVRLHAVDDLGRATSTELPLGRDPILLRGEAARGMALHVSGSTGYDEMETILGPSIAGVPQVVDTAIAGRELYRGVLLGLVDIRVTGNRAEVTPPIGFDLFPSSQSGGQVGVRVTVPKITIFADGISDYGFFGTDSWTATGTATNVTVSGGLALEPAAGGERLEVVSSGFTVTIGSFDVSVSGFLDRLGIFDGLVNFLIDVFREDVESAVREAIEDAANNEFLPAIADAFSNLRLSLALGDVALDAKFHDVRESVEGLSVLFDATWTGSSRDASYPAYPGSTAQFAPYPVFPIDEAVSHPVDATIAFSEDSLAQALSEIVATGALSTSFDLADVESPIPLVLGTISSIVEPRLLALPDVSPSDPVVMRLIARKGPVVGIGRGVVGEPLVADGAEWRYRVGTTEPPANWTDRGFVDSLWAKGRSGFGYSSDPEELFGVRTRLEELASGSATTLYLRAPFSVADPAALLGLHLRILYDDSFVAYLNGHEVARRNVLGDPPLHDAVATAAREPTWEEIDVSAHVDRLVAGQNVLAIHGHNISTRSSDFVLTPSLVTPREPPPEALAALPAQVIFEEVELTFLADTDADGVGATDADGVADEVELFAYAFAFTLQAELLLFESPSGTPSISFRLDEGSASQAAGFPASIVGGPGGLRIRVAREAYDTDDADLLELARLLIALMGPILGETLSEFELPSIPLPELAFDTDQDGAPDVRLAIANATLRAVDTDGGTADWLAVLTDLRSASP